MSSTNSAATHIGRIGGLAVALGVGAAIASGTGVAWADTTDGGPSTSASSDSAGSSSDSASSKTASSKEAAPSKSAKDKSAYRESQRDKESPKDSPSDETGADQPSRTPAKDAEPGDAGAKDAEPEDAEPKDADSKDNSTSAAKDESAAEAAEADSTKAAVNKSSSPTREREQPVTVNAVSVTAAGGELSAPIAVSTPAAATPVAETATAQAAEEAPARPRLVTRLMSAFGVKETATGSPATPAQSPALTALLGWVRREIGGSYTNTSQISSAIKSDGAAAAVVDPLPGDLDSRWAGWVTGPGITDKPGGFNIYGTDLGIMWDGGTIDGERFVHVAFGDTFSGPDMQGGWRNNVLLLSFDNDLDNGLGLAQTGPAFQFIPRSDGQVGLFGSEVTVIPTAGIHIDGTQYVNYMSVRSWDVPGRWTTNYSAISQFYPGTEGGDWRIVPSTIRSSGWFKSSTPYRPGDQNFQQMAYVLQPEDQVAEGDPRYLYAFGTPSGRAGSAYLSRVAEGDVTDLSKYEYWDGGNWVVGNAAVAKPVIGSDRSSGLFGFAVDWANDPNVFGGYLGGLFGAKTGGNVSEMSVQYNEYLDKYVVLYGDGNNNIQMRLADTPEGAWSDPVQLASSSQYPGLYAPMIHPWSGTGLLEDNNGNADYNNLYWNMSLWGDYNVVLMETDLSPLKPIEV
jgi:hypothetical protein